MIGKETQGSRLASIYDVKEILEEKKKSSELGYEQKMAYEYVIKFAKLDKAETKKMMKDLEQFDLKERTVMKIMEVLPVDPNQLKLMLVDEKKNFDDETIKKIMAVVDAYRGK
ncbi:MAG: hypothetical protein KGH72_04660 [Candidatus Micrarchaeota archaeon]|nr:hypothetical protein [Candidatus Micrarchaeota archaeon]